MDLCISVHQILSLVQPDNGSSCGTLRNIFGILTIHHLILYIYIQWKVNYPNVNHPRCRLYELLTRPDRSLDAYDP